MLTKYTLLTGTEKANASLSPDSETFNVSGSALLFWPFTSWLSRRQVPISGSGAPYTAAGKKIAANKRTSVCFTWSYYLSPRRCRTFDQRRLALHIRFSTDRRIGVSPCSASPQILPGRASVQPFHPFRSGRFPERR